jgi:hypothetical protein
MCPIASLFVRPRATWGANFDVDAQVPASPRRDVHSDDIPCSGGVQLAGTAVEGLQ